MQELATWEARMTAARLDVEGALRDDVITPDQAEDATLGLDRADEALEVARGILLNDGTMATASGQLAIARDVLTQLGNLLGKVYIDGSADHAYRRPASDPNSGWGHQLAAGFSRDGAEGGWALG